MSWVVNKFKDEVLDPILGVGQNLVDFAVDEVIDPILTAVSSIVEYALDNPIEAVAMIAAAYFSGGLSLPQQAALVGVGSGTQALVDGESLEDAVKAAVISSATAFAGSTVSTFINPSVTEATQSVLGNTQLSSTVSTAITKGATSATKTYIQTGDLDAAGKSFLASAAVSVGSDAVDAGTTVANRKLGINAAADDIMGNVGQALEDSSLGASVNDLSTGVSNALKAGIAAELTGQDVSSAMLRASTGSILEAVGSADFVERYVGDEGFISGIVDKYVPVAEYMQGVVDNFKTSAGENLTDAQIKILTDSTVAAWDMARQGNPELAGETFFGKDGLGKLGYDYIEDILTDPINNALDSITGTYDATVEAATNLNEADIAYQALFAPLEGLVATRDAALDTFNANNTQANANAYNTANAAVKTQNDKVIAEQDGLLAALNTATTAYNTAYQYVMSDVENLDAEQIKMSDAAIKAAVEATVPNFSSQSHKEFYGLENDADAHKHYLLDGQKGPGSKTEAEAALDQIRLSTVQSALAAKGIPLDALKPGQLASYLAYADKEIKSVASITGLDTEVFANNMVTAAALTPELTTALKDAGFIPQSTDEYNMFLTGEYVKLDVIRNPNDGGDGSNVFIPTTYPDGVGMSAEDVLGMITDAGFSADNIVNVGGEFYNRPGSGAKSRPGGGSANISVFDKPDIESVNTAVLLGDVPTPTLDTVALGEGVDINALLNGGATLVNTGGKLSWELATTQQAAIGKNTNLNNVLGQKDKTMYPDGTLIPTTASATLLPAVTFTNQYGAGNVDTFVFNTEYMETGEDGVRRFTSVPPFAASLSEDKTQAYNADGQVIGVIDSSPLMASTIAGMTDDQGKNFDNATNSNFHKALVSFYTRIRASFSTEENKDTWDNAASLFLQAGGGLVDAVAGLDVLKKEYPDTNFSAYADYILSASDNIQSVEWRQNAPKIEVLKMAPLNAWYEANPGEEPNPLDAAAMYLEGVYGAQEKYPTQALSEIAVEILQEGPLLGIAKFSQLLTKSAVYAASKNAAKTLGNLVGMGTAGALNIAEAAGATANGTYDTVYAAKLKKLGVTAETATPEQLQAAHKIAAEAGQHSGTIAGLTTAVLFAGGQGSALDSLLIGTSKSTTAKSILTQFSTNVLDLAGAIASESVSETIEEILPQISTDAYLRSIDPSYVRGYDNVARAGVDAFIIGGAVTGTLGSPTLLNLTMETAQAKIAAGNILHTIAGGITSTGNVIADVLTKINASVMNVFKTTSTAEEATTALNELGLTDTVVLNNVLNSTYDTMYVSTNEAAKIFKDTQPGFIPTKDEIESFVSKRAESDVATAVAQYIDPRFLDADEVKAAALEEGLALTTEQALQYTKQAGNDDEDFDEAAAITALRTELDPQGTSKQDIRDKIAAQDEPYDASDNEITTLFDQGITDGGVSDTALDELLFGENGFVNVRQITKDEARIALAAQNNYDPSDEDIAAFTKQHKDISRDILRASVGLGEFDGLTKEEKAAKTPEYDINNDGKLTTEDAVLASQQGTDFTDATLAGVESYVDLRQVDEAEAIAAYAALGIENPQPADIALLVGDNLESGLAAAAEANLPTARYNSLVDVFNNIEVGLDATEVGTAITTALTGFDNLSAAEVETAITTALAGRNNLSPNDVAEITTGIVGEPAGQDDAGNDVAATGLYAKIENEINTAVGAPATYITNADGTQIVDQEATGVYAKIAEVNEAVVSGNITTVEALALIGAPAAAVDNPNTEVDETIATGVYADIAGLNNLSEADVQGIIGKPASETTDNVATGVYANLDTINTKLAELNNLSEQNVTDITNEIVGRPAAAVDNPDTEVDETVATGVYAELEALGLTTAQTADFIGAPAGIDGFGNPIDATGVYAKLTTLDADMLTEGDVQGITTDIVGAPAGQDTEGNDVPASGIYADIDVIAGNVDTLTDTIGVADAGDPDTVGADPTGLFATIAAYENAGIGRDDAIAKAVDDLAKAGVADKADLLAAVGDPGVADNPNTPDVNEYVAPSGIYTALNTINAGVGALSGDVGDLSGDVGDVSDTLGAPATYITDANGDLVIDQEATGLFATIAANEALGLSRDEATAAAVTQLSTDLGTTETTLLTALGTTETNLTKTIGDTETRLTTAVGDVETRLTAAVGDVETNLGANIQTVADFVGKPASNVTQDDIDFVVDLVAQNVVANEQVATEQQILDYDVTGDGAVDQSDVNLLTGYFGGDTTTALADTSMFNPATGLYLQQEQDTQTTLDAITDMNTDINTQIDTQTQQANFNNFRDLLSNASDLGGQRVDVKSGDKVNLDYLYDFSDIFATPDQAALFGSPYGPSPRGNPRGGTFAQGGQVEDENDMLLRLLGEM